MYNESKEHHILTGLSGCNVKERINRRNIKIYCQGTIELFIVLSGGTTIALCMYSIHSVLVYTTLHQLCGVHTVHCTVYILPGAVV